MSGGTATRAEAVGRPDPGDHGPARQGHLRIGIALDGLKLGGAQVNALDLARELRRRGHHVLMFAFDHPVSVSFEPLARSCGFEITVLPAEPDLLRQARLIRDVVGGADLDVVHVFGPWLGAPATLALWDRPGTALLILNWMMTNVRGLVPSTPLVLGTEALRDEAARSSRAPVWLLEPPVDTELDRASPEASAAFRDLWGVAPGTTLVVVVSRLDHDLKAEGIANAISAVAAAEDPALQLVVVGDGDARPVLGALADRVNTAAGRRVVLLTGALQDPRPAYSAADLVLAMGGAAIRALAFGKPLVVLGEQGFSRPYTPETKGYFDRNGFYGRGGDGTDPVQLLRDQILAMTRPEVTGALGSWGRDVVLQRYSVTVCTDHLLEMYGEVRARTNARRRAADVAHVLARFVGGRLRRRLTTRSRGPLRPAGPAGAAR